MFFMIAILLFVEPCLAKDKVEILKAREKNSISLELEFTKQKEKGLRKIISLFDNEPNAYATGFFVGPRLVLTAYHVVSGNLDVTKKMALGFGINDQLAVKIFTNGCQARVVSVDKDADLALLEVCAVSEHSISPQFQTNIAKDEKLLLIARPNGEKFVGHGTFFGAYSFNGIEYWSAKISARDGFSGSPIYNQDGEVIGVFSGYDWSQKLAVISPAARAQKLMADFASSGKS